MFVQLSKNVPLFLEGTPGPKKFSGVGDQLLVSGRRVPARAGVVDRWEYPGPGTWTGQSNLTGRFMGSVQFPPAMDRAPNTGRWLHQPSPLAQFAEPTVGLQDASCPLRAGRCLASPRRSR